MVNKVNDAVNIVNNLVNKVNTHEPHELESKS